MRSSILKSALCSLALLSIAACSSDGGGGGGSDGATTGPPAAQIEIVQSITGGTGTTYQFFGQGADPDCDVLTFSWDLDDDGTEDSTLQSPMFTYNTQGDFTVTLEVTDASGLTAEATAVVSIRNAPPASTADPASQIRCQTLLATEGLETYFIAGAEESDGGTITTCDWDFDGDGTFDLTTALSQAPFTYTTAGQFTPRVRANSSDGSSSIATLTLYVCPAGSMAELGPGVQVERDPAGVTDDTAGGVSSFLAMGADQDGGATTFEWDFDGNGVFGDGTPVPGTGGRVVDTDPWIAGPAFARVEATDNEGKTSTAQAALDIPPYAGNRNPVAFARACTLLGSINTPIQFLGEGADFEDGTVGITFSWDLDGDGTVDSTDQNPRFTFTEPGTYRPTLRVTDSTAAPFTGVAEAYLTLVVECCTSPGGGGGPPPPPTKYWWCDCDDTYIFHGGNADVEIVCPTIIGATGGPTEAGVTACNGMGGAGGDPFCMQTLISQPPLLGSGPPFFPPAALFPVPAAPWTFNFLSDGVDTPLRVVQYTVQLKLREPGCRVQILKCQVYVLHGFIGGGGGGDDLGGGDFRIDLMLMVNAPVGVQYPIPPIFDVEIFPGDQNPPWNFVDTTLAVLPAGWMQMALPGGAVRFFTTTNPLVPGQPVNFGNIFGQTNNNTQPNSIRVRLSRLDGSIVGQEQLQVVTVP